MAWVRLRMLGALACLGALVVLPVLPQHEGAALRRIRRNPRRKCTVRLPTDESPSPRKLTPRGRAFCISVTMAMTAECWHLERSRCHAGSRLYFSCPFLPPEARRAAPCDA